MVHLTHEVNLVFQVPFSGQLLHAVQLAVAVDIGADHHHPDSILGVHLRRGFHQEVQALQWLDPANVQQDLIAVQAQAGPHRIPVKGAEHGEIHTAGHQRDLAGVGAVKPRHGVPFVGREGDDAVGGGHHFGFDHRSFSLLHLAGPGLHLYKAQRMEGNDMGNAHFLGQFTADP